LSFGEESDFSAEIAAGEVMQPNFGEKPEARFYYLNLPKKFIAGTVYDPVEQEVVVGATCTLGGAGTGTVTTDEWGDFWFEGLEAGTYTLTISANGKTKTLADIDASKDIGLGDIALE
jgi:hypothetical protein